MRVLILEPERTISKCVELELKKLNIDSVSVTTAADAISSVDGSEFDAVVSEITLPGHSGTEFLYEFRTYPEWSEVPVVLFSTIRLSETVTNSKDWTLLNVSKIFYKPEHSIQELVHAVQDLKNSA